MMFLSRVELDPSDTQLIRRLDQILLSPDLLHKLVYSAFPPGEHGVPRGNGVGVLYRREPELHDGCVSVLVQSGLEPDWTNGAFKEILQRRPPKTRFISPVLHNGAELRFRLRANATRREPGGHEIDPRTGRAKLGPRVSVTNKGHQRDTAYRELTEKLGFPPNGALVSEYLLRQWLVRRLRDAGAEAVDFRVVDEGCVVDRGRALEHHSALFDGCLRVTNGAQLGEALQRGIGSAKAFGFGLLSLASAG